MEDLSYEQQAHDAGYALVCGVDEAGAGPLMGPVYAAAVILPEKFELPGLNDSKKLTEKKREALFLRIQQQALTWSVASVSAGEIDETDILSARMKAMQLAIDGLAPRPDFALIDGNRDHGKFAAVTTPPGILWPKFDDPEVGKRLAFTGAVKDDVLDIEELACYLMDYLAAHYADTLTERYKIEVEPGDTGYELLEKAGRKRGFLMRGAQVDTERMARILLDEFRAGKLGRFTLETAPTEEVTP